MTRFPRQRTRRATAGAFASLCATFVVALWLVVCCAGSAATSVEHQAVEAASCCATGTDADANLEGESCCGGCGTTADGNCACGMIPGKGCCCSERKEQGLAACSDSCGCGAQGHEPASGEPDESKRSAPTAHSFERQTPPPDAEDAFFMRPRARVSAPAIGIEPPPPRTVA